MKTIVFAAIASFVGLAVMQSPVMTQQVSQPAGMDLSDDSPVTTQHQITAGNRTLKYTARAGYLTLRTDFREIKARIFYVSYMLDRGNDRTPRPLTFAWNGGPGSPASTLHLGMLGPRRGKTMDEYKTEPPPYELVDNSDSWLSFTDLVLVDPVGTGYSYTTKPEYLKEFWSTIGDIDCIAEFIRLYQVHFNLGDAPLFVAGESYGTTRATGVAKNLTDRRIPLSGVILLSGGNVGGRGDSSDLSPVLLLPSLTASAFFYKKLPADLQTDLQSTLRKVEAWSQNEYSVALMKGDRLKGEERQAVIAQLARFTGLDPSLIARADLRVNADMFARGLFREQNLELGHYGAHLNWKMTSPNAPYDLWQDPSLVSNGVNGLIVPYLRTELGFSVDARYAGPWGGGWPSPTTPRGDWTGLNWDRSGANANVNLGAGLAEAMRRIPTLRIFVIHGYYDLVTPYFAGEYFVSHLGLDPALRKNVVFANYPGGHSMYSEKATLHQMSIDVGEFIKNTVPAKRPTPSVQP